MTTVDPWNLQTPGEIRFGWGRRRELADVVAAQGRRAHLVLGSRTLARSSLVAELLAALRSKSIEIGAPTLIDHEPLVTDVDALVDHLRALDARSEQDVVLAIGGGAAIDLAKAAAGLTPDTQGKSVRDYLEGVGRGLALRRPGLPLVALPTTGGTGSEATLNAVISSLDPPYKKSLRSPHLLARAVLVDPELAVSLPAAATAHSGMDALTQLVESYLSCRATPVTQALCRTGLESLVPALETAVRDPQARWARERLAQAALLSGVALANSGLGMAHGVAAALGVSYGVPHGLACATMLPIALSANLACCVDRLAEVAPLLTGERDASPEAAAEQVVLRIGLLCDTLAIPRRLSAFGVRAEELARLARDSQGNSLRGNPRPIEPTELEAILATHL